MTNGYDALVRESLRNREPGGGPCLDAEIAAAWFDGTLSPAEREAAETHAADCSRCQALLAALARTEPAMQRAWWRAPAVRWIGPLAAAAAAAAIWINVARREAAEPSVPAAPVSTEARAEAPPAAEAARPASPRSPDPAPRFRDSANLRSADPAIPRSPDPAAPQAAPLPQVASGISGAVGGAVPSPTPPAAEPPARPEAQAAAAPERSRLAAAAGAAPSDADVRTVTSAEAAIPRALNEAVIVSSGRGARAGVLITPAGRTTQWRITPAGGVERSVDAGITWQAHQTGAPGPLTAGSSPSESVIWLVGRRGVVLVSDDAGQTWKRQDVPEPVDLTAVAAADATTAVVTAANGRQFRTTANGWR